MILTRFDMISFKLWIDLVLKINLLSGYFYALTHIGFPQSWMEVHLGSFGHLEEFYKVVNYLPSYILMVDSFCRGLWFERHREKLPSTRFGLGIKSLKHSHFVDDTLLIGGGSTIISCRFKNVLEDFLKASGKLTN